MFQLECPVPDFPYETITLGHGSGGKLTHQLLKSGVFSLFNNPWLQEEHDGATLHLQGRNAFSTDSYVVKPIFFPGGNIGDLAIHGTINDLAMCGAKPQFMSLGLILEEGLSFRDLWVILQTIRQRAEEAGVHIVTGDTKVVEKGKGDLVYINTSGLGGIHPAARIGYQHVEDGDLILISGEIGNHGIAILSCREGLQFETKLQSDTRPLHLMTGALLDELGPDIHFMRDPTRGGLASVLNELAEKTGKNMLLDQRWIPIPEEVEGACEMLGLDPLYVANEGIFTLVVKASAADKALEILHRFKGSEAASLIGEVRSAPAGKVLMNMRSGGSRVINFLPGEQLPRIC